MISSLIAQAGGLLNATNIHIEDNYRAQRANKIILECPNRGITIEGLINKSFALDVQAQWKEFLTESAGGVLAKPVQLAENVGQIAFKGRTIRQPWFGRKLYQGTTNFAFTLSFDFVAVESAYDEVFRPAMGLVSLLYPRLDKSLAGKQDTGTEASFLSTYFIPGPNLFDASSGSALGGGDATKVTIGNMFSLTKCYLEKVSLDVSYAMSTDGYPQKISASVLVTAMDNSYVNNNGEFSLKNGTSLAFSAMSLGEPVENFIKMATDENLSTKDKITKVGSMVKNLLPFK